MTTATAEKTPASSEPLRETAAQNDAELKAKIASRASWPIFVVTGPAAIALEAGTFIALAGKLHDYPSRTPIAFDDPVPGVDYVVGVSREGELKAWRATEGEAERPFVIGGFHYALGGNAEARAGGSLEPQINPLSCWDLGFRPTCPDPRGMAYVAQVPGAEGVKPFWVDIYLLNRDHLKLGTSVAGAEISDGGSNRPRKADGKPEGKLDYATAVRLLEGHGKGLLGINEFFAAAYGVTEKTGVYDKPQLAGLDSLRTSRVGMMQATGNLYVWGNDEDPDSRRACVFGGHWGDGGWAGSRYASVESWPDVSSGWLGARGRSDHLQLEQSAR